MKHVPLPTGEPVGGSITSPPLYHQLGTRPSYASLMSLNVCARSWNGCLSMIKTMIPTPFTSEIAGNWSTRCLNFWIG
jgi:hypothetical protein